MYNIKERVDNLCKVILNDLEDSCAADSPLKAKIASAREKIFGTDIDADQDVVNKTLLSAPGLGALTIFKEAMQIVADGLGMKIVDRLDAATSLTENDICVWNIDIAAINERNTEFGGLPSGATKPKIRLEIPETAFRTSGLSVVFATTREDNPQDAEMFDNIKQQAMESGSPVSVIARQFPSRKTMENQAGVQYEGLYDMMKAKGPRTKFAVGK